MWTMGIRDCRILKAVKRMLKAPILANIVLNELDHCIESNWEENPIVYKYVPGKNGNKNHGYRAMRKTKLKEMYIVRYADDFRIFCREIRSFTGENASSQRETQIFRVLGL